MLGAGQAVLPVHVADKIHANTRRVAFLCQPHSQLNKLALVSYFFERTGVQLHLLIMRSALQVVILPDLHELAESIFK